MKNFLTDEERAAHEVGMVAAQKVCYETGKSGWLVAKEVSDAYNYARIAVIAVFNKPTE